MSDTLSARIKIGRRLRSERRRLGWGQVETAEIGGVGRATQFRYEKDEALPDADYLRRLHDAGVDLMYVVAGKRMRLATDNSVTIDRTTLMQLLLLATSADCDSNDRGLAVQLAAMQLPVLLSKLAAKPLTREELRQTVGEMMEPNSGEEHGA